MNRQEKHQLVVQFYNEGKTMREISKELHMSFSDIGSITKKLNEELEPNRKEISIESQALALFKKGDHPVKVALSLDLSPSKTESIYKQYWKLRGLYDLLDLYKIVKTDISLLENVHDVVKKYDLRKKDMINIIGYADKYHILKEDIQELEVQFDRLLKQRHHANDVLISAKKQYAELLEQIDKNNVINVRKSSHIEDLNNEIKKMETYISLLRSSNEYYTKFEQVAREKLDLIMKDHRWVLALAIDAVIESMRKEPFKEMMINGVITDEEAKDKLLELCGALFDKLLKQLTDATFLANQDREIKKG